MLTHAFDMCDMSRELDILLYVSGGGSSGQTATRGISLVTTLQALTKACNREYVNKNTSVLALWLKCKNLEGVSRKYKKLRSAGRHLEKYRVQHPFRKTSRHLRSHKTMLVLFGQVLSRVWLAQTLQRWVIFDQFLPTSES
jgi:hypothetical protein